MEKYIDRIFIISCILLMLPTVGFSQKKVLGKPMNYNRPIDFFDNPADYQTYLLKTSPKSKDNAWLVFSDRAENPVYSKPGGKVLFDKKINFRDYFFVVDEKDEWIKIIKARVNGLKIQKDSKEEVGWVRKENMLVWNSSVSGRVSRIHKKVLLLNRADQIDKILLRPEKEMVKIYSDPEKTNEEAPRRIFEYFFLLKEQNNMFLLAEESNVNPYAPEKIVGWVDVRDSDVWNTRICLEPNFKAQAAKERYGNPQKIIRAYDKNTNARKSVDGVSKEDGVFWKNDPVILNRDEKSKSDSNRFLGSVIRFPMISMSGNQGKEVYKSGIVGTVKLKSKDGNIIREVKETKLAKLEKRQKILESKASKINIFYVIEGTDYTYQFKDAIVNTMSEISRDLGKENLQNT